MNAIKFALLGTAALVAVSASARAEDLSGLKADMEAINASTAVAVADVPASTSVVWTGTAKAAVVYDELSIDEITFLANVELNVTGTTETSVGEVGASARLKQSWDGHAAGASDVEIVRGYGWWKVTPDVKIWAGRTGGNGGIGHGLDKCSCNFVGAAGATGGTDDAVQFGMSYASGPASVSLAIEDHGVDSFIAAADINWSGDTFSAELAGFAGEEAGVNVWQVGIGATASMDMFTVSASAGYGSIAGAEYLNASLFARAALSDSVSAEIGVGYIDPAGPGDRIDIAGGVYWSPASQLTVGLEAGVDDVGGVDAMSAALVTVFKF
jgi:hypothetical protein